jgi:hypothetical protein
LFAAPIVKGHDIESIFWMSVGPTVGEDKPGLLPAATVSPGGAPLR